MTAFNMAINDNTTNYGSGGSLVPSAIPYGVPTVFPSATNPFVTDTPLPFCSAHIISSWRWDGQHWVGNCPTCTMQVKASTAPAEFLAEKVKTLLGGIMAYSEDCADDGELTKLLSLFQDLKDVVDSNLTKANWMSSLISLAEDMIRQKELYAD